MAHPTNYSASLDHHGRYLQSRNYTGHYDPTKHTHEQNIKALQKALAIRTKEAISKLEGLNGVSVIDENQQYKLSLIKDSDKGMIFQIELKGEIKSLNNLKGFWGHVCHDVFEFAISKLGFDVIDILAAKEIAIKIAKEVLGRWITGVVAGLVVKFIWFETAEKHVGIFANKAANRICHTNYKNLDQNNNRTNAKNRRHSKNTSAGRKY
jgi:hypothetical protein